MTTNSKMECALALAEYGFHVFPLEPDSKIPLISKWQKKATRDAEQIKKWWTCPVLDYEQDYNIGIFTGRFGVNRSLLVIDVDQKADVDGATNLTLLLAEIGEEIPETLISETPTGGKHIIFVVDEAIKQGVNVLGKGLDIRSRGGYIVGPGSTTDKGEYKWVTDR